MAATLLTAMGPPSLPITCLSRCSTKCHANGSATQAATTPSGAMSTANTAHAPCPCSRPRKTTSTIALNNQYDVNNALIAAGINPQLASSLPTSQVQSALTNYLGSKPVLSCSSSSLLEVWTCVDTSLKAFDCPSSLTGRSCPSTIAFPSGAGVPQKCQQYYNGSTTSAPSSGSPSGSSSGGGTTTAASGAAFVAAGVAAALALAGAVMV